MRKAFVIASILALTLASAIQATAPQLINYQGRLTDAAGDPVADGPYSVVFTIYDAAVAGASVWTETQNVSTTDGLFAVLLGTVNPVLDTVFKGTTRYLGIAVAGDPELSPRVALVSVPYSHRVNTVDGAAGGNITSKVSIGPGHTLTGNDAGIGGGHSNIASGQESYVGGGHGNTASSHDATVGGGFNNIAIGLASTVGGGSGNKASSSFATVGGGENNTANVTRSTVSGGNNNTAGQIYTTVSGGSFNASIAQYAVVGGGLFDTASGNIATVSGGVSNLASGNISSIGGGIQNRAIGALTSISGGQNNRASDTGATVGGGSYNKARGIYSVVAGGGGSTVADSNSASGGYSAIGGGRINTASDFYATVGGGIDNTASGEIAATVGGGSSNRATGNFSTIPGGSLNSATAIYTFAAGLRAKANHEGSIVIAANNSTFNSDSTASSQNEQIVLRADGHFYLTDVSGVASTPAGKFLNTSTGAYLTTAGVWTNVSDANLKENFTPVNGEDVLEKISELSISEWNYKEDDESVKHIGPVAQEFYALFGVGSDDESISTIDPAGIALAAIQALYEKSKRVDALEARMEKLEKLLEKQNKK